MTVTNLLERLQAALADRYTIEREIGSGGMATVYHAEDQRHHRKVAVKVLRPELAARLLGPVHLDLETLTLRYALPLRDEGEPEPTWSHNGRLVLRRPLV